MVMVFGLEKGKETVEPTPPPWPGMVRLGGFVFPPPGPSCRLLRFVFPSFLLFSFISIKNKHTHTQEKGQKSCLGGGCYTGWAQGWLCPLCHRLGGSMCWGIPPWVVCPLWVVSPMLFVPQSSPPRCLRGVSQESNCPHTPPHCVPRTMCLRVPSPGGDQRQGTPPTPPPQTSACPLCGRLALPPPPPAGNWD